MRHLVLISWDNPLKGVANHWERERTPCKVDNIWISWSHHDSLLGTSKLFQFFSRARICQWKKVVVPCCWSNLDQARQIFSFCINRCQWLWIFSSTLHWSYIRCSISLIAGNKHQSLHVSPLAGNRQVYCGLDCKQSEPACCSESVASYLSSNWDQMHRLLPP